MDINKLVKQILSNKDDKNSIDSALADFFRDESSSFSDNDGNIFRVKIRDESAVLVGANIKTAKVFVPASFEAEDGTEYPITTIGSSAFCGQQAVKHIFFPEGVKILQDGLFADCGSVLSVYIPSTVEKLNAVFWKCPTIEENAGGIIYYSGTLEQWRNLIDSNENRSMMDYTEYDNVVRFVDASSFSFPEIDFQTIYDAENEEEFSAIRIYDRGEEVTIPLSYVDENGENKPITHIGRSSFAGNNKIKKVIIPKSIKRICNDAFYGCKNLTEVIIEESDSPIDIGMGAFFGCDKLNAIFMGREYELAQYAIDETKTMIVKI